MTTECNYNTSWDLEPVPYPEESGEDGWYLHRGDSEEPLFLSASEVSPEDARLIAAAPELLSALQEARDYLADLLGSQEDEVIDNLVNNGEEVEARLYAAIAKATQK